MFIPHSLCRRFCCARTGWTWWTPWSCCHPHSSWQISAECQDQIVYLSRCRHRGGRDGNYSELDGCLLLSKYFSYFDFFEKDTLVLMIEAHSPFERVLLHGMMVSRMTRPVNTQVNDYKWWFWSPEELFALNTWMSAQSERSRCRWWGRGWRCWWWRSPGFQHWMQNKTKGTNIIELTVKRTTRKEITLLQVPSSKVQVPVWSLYDTIL